MVNAVAGASQDSMVHAVLAFYDPKGTYARHAAVVVASIFANAKYPVCVHILTMTPYAAETKELISPIRKYLSSATYSHHHSSDCVKQVKKQILDIIFNAHIPTVPHILTAMFSRGRAHAPAKKLTNYNSLSVINSSLMRDL